MIPADRDQLKATYRDIIANFRTNKKIDTDLLNFTAEQLNNLYKYVYSSGAADEVDNVKIITWGLTNFFKSKLGSADTAAMHIINSLDRFYPGMFDEYFKRIDNTPFDNIEITDTVSLNNNDTGAFVGFRANTLDLHRVTRPNLSVQGESPLTGSYVTNVILPGSPTGVEQVPVAFFSGVQNGFLKTVTVPDKSDIKIFGNGAFSKSQMEDPELKINCKLLQGVIPPFLVPKYEMEFYNRVLPDIQRKTAPTTPSTPTEV